MSPRCEVHKATMITRAAVQSIAIGTMRFDWGNRITDSTLGQGVSKRTLVGKQCAIGFDMPIRVLSRKVRIPVLPDIRLSLQPTFVTVAGCGSFSNNLVPPRPLLHNEKLGCPFKACTFVRESPTRFHPTVPQKLHGSADCVPFTGVLSSVVWAEILSTSNPARNAATALPARLVAEGNYLRLLAEEWKRPASPFSSIQNLDDQTSLRVSIRTKSLPPHLFRNSTRPAAVV